MGKIFSQISKPFQFLTQGGRKQCLTLGKDITSVYVEVHTLSFLIFMIVSIFITVMSKRLYNIIVESIQQICDENGIFSFPTYYFQLIFCIVQLFFLFIFYTLTISTLYNKNFKNFDLKNPLFICGMISIFILIIIVIVYYFLNLNKTLSKEASEPLIQHVANVCSDDNNYIPNISTSTTCQYLITSIIIVFNLSLLFLYWFLSKKCVTV
jgi:hypothetical protein